MITAALIIKSGMTGDAYFWLYLLTFAADLALVSRFGGVTKK